jgi:hypothetical protein
VTGAKLSGNFAEAFVSTSNRNVRFGRASVRMVRSCHWPLRIGAVPSGRISVSRPDTVYQPILKDRSVLNPDLTPRMTRSRKSPPACVRGPAAPDPNWLGMGSEIRASSVGPSENAFRIVHFVAPKTPLRGPHNPLVVGSSPTGPTTSLHSCRTSVDYSSSRITPMRSEPYEAVLHRPGRFHPYCPSLFFD